MAICSFVGHGEVYDADIESRIQAAVNQLIAEHTTVEFLIYPNGMLSYILMLEALRARTYYPQKVTITFISSHSSTAEMGAYELTFFYLSDKTINLNISTSKKDDPRVNYRRKLQNVVQNSTHVFSYFYEKLYDSDRQFTKVPETSKIISLTTHETEIAIDDFVLHMTEREQLIFRKMNDGCTLKEAGASVGVKSERARQILQHGCRTMRVYLRERYHKELSAEQQRQCGLFCLGEATYKSLTCFRYIVDFLGSIYNANKVYVEQSCASSGFLFVLADSCLSYTTRKDMHITALIGSNSSPKDCDDLEAIKEMLCPPCHAVGYVGRAGSEYSTDNFDVVADLIERMDFCICDLSATPYANKIIQYAAHTKQAVLLDLCAGKRGQ